MKIKIDLEADAMYISFRKGKFYKNKKIDNKTIADFDKNGNILGIELLAIKERIPAKSLAEVSVSKV